MKKMPAKHGKTLEMTKVKRYPPNQLRFTESAREVKVVRRKISFRRCYSEDMLAIPPDTVAYYYGHISRDNAEHVLWSHGCKDGMYLLRASLNSDADYVLSICYNKQIRHYRITKDVHGMHCLDGYLNERYHGPVELVENIRALPCRPVIPVIKPLHLFMPGVNCGITEEKLQATLRKKAKEWCLEEDTVNNIAKNRDSEFWKVLHQCIHEVENWFHGKISRAEAEVRLGETKMENGTFLVRQRDDCSFSLCLCHDGKVKHYKIDILSSGEVAIQDGPRFDNLISLVSHYSVFNDGLWCNLQEPCICSQAQQEAQIELSSRPNINFGGFPAQQNGLNGISDLINTEPRLKSALDDRITISPIAAHRNGTVTALHKPKTEMTPPKAGSSKGSVTAWFRNQFFKGANDAKPTVELREKKSPSPTERFVPIIPTPPLPAKNIRRPPPIGLSVRVSPPSVDATVPENVSPTFKDHNDNDWKKGSSSSFSNNLPNPCSPVAKLPATIDNVIAGWNLFGSQLELPQLSPESQSAIIVNRPLPVPRKKPPVAPRVRIPSSDESKNVSRKTSTSSRKLSNVELSPVESSPNSSPIRMSPETPIEILNQNLIRRFSSKDDLFWGSKQEFVGNKHPSEESLSSGGRSRSNSGSPTSECSKPFPANKLLMPAPLVAELKARVTNGKEREVGITDPSVPLTDSPSTPPPPPPCQAPQENPNLARDIEEHIKAKSEAAHRPKLGKSLSSKSQTEPQYVEIDRYYQSDSEGTKSPCASDTEEAGRSSIETAEEVQSPSSLYNSHVTDSKWDDTSEESSPSMTKAPRTPPRKCPWTKEESERHFKTIKRHHKNLCSIDRKNLTFQEKLGLGNFGDVCKAVFKSGNDEVLCAVKSLRHSSLPSGREEILREARIMVRLDHPHIVRLLAVSEGDPFLLVMELASLGPLNIYLKKNPSFPIRDVLMLMYQVALGMQYLESSQFVHRDLAARNVLLVNESFAKISDFGMSKALGLNSDYYTVEPKGKLPLKWYAPECIYYFRFSSKSDVWSYGVTLWEALSYGNKPYLGMTGREILTMFSTESRLSCPEKCPGEIYDMMWNCWQLRPEDRPTFSDLVLMLKTYLNIE